MRQDTGTITYEQMGVAAMLPGMVHMLELMLAAVNEMRALLGDAQVTGAAPPKRLGRPPLNRGRSGWPEDPEERKAEMKRRQAVAARKAGKLPAEPTHPRDPRHPGHDAWVKKLKAGQKKRWNSLTPAQQKAQIRKMTKGKAAAGATARAAVEEMKAAS